MLRGPGRKDGVEYGGVAISALFTSVIRPVMSLESEPKKKKNIEPAIEGLNEPPPGFGQCDMEKPWREGSLRTSELANRRADESESQFFWACTHPRVADPLSVPNPDH